MPVRIGATIVTARETFLGCPIDLLTMKETLEVAANAMRRRNLVVHTGMNVAKLVDMRRDPLLCADVGGSDVIGIDGMGVVWGARLLGLPIPERVPGIDLMEELLRLCAREGFRPYLLGARRDVLVRAVENLTRRFPSLQLAGYRDGYFTAADEAEVVRSIREAGADCLFIGISSPKKERFVGNYAGELGVPFVMGVGGSLDVVAGLVRRAPIWVRRAGVEWAYRVAQEPRRMWWRYLRTNCVFLGLMARELARRAFRSDHSTARALR